MQQFPFKRRGPRADVPCWVLKPGKVDSALHGALVVAFGGGLLAFIAELAPEQADPAQIANRTIASAPSAAGLPTTQSAPVLAAAQSDPAHFH